MQLLEKVAYFPVWQNVRSMPQRGIKRKIYIRPPVYTSVKENQQNFAVFVWDIAVFTG